MRCSKLFTAGRSCNPPPDWDPYALASLLSPRGFTAEATSPLPSVIDQQGGPHFAPRAQACDLLVPVGGSLTNGPVRLEASTGGPARQRTARFGPARTATDRHDVEASQFSRCTDQVSICSARPVGCVGQRTVAAHGEDGRRIVRLSARCTPRRSITIRPSRSFQTGHQQPAGRASAPGSSTAWAARTATCRRSS